MRTVCKILCTVCPVSQPQSILSELIKPMFIWQMLGTLRITYKTWEKGCCVLTSCIESIHNLTRPMSWAVHAHCCSLLSTPAQCSLLLSAHSCSLLLTLAHSCSLLKQYNKIGMEPGSIPFSATTHSCTSTRLCRNLPSVPKYAHHYSKSWLGIINGEHSLFAG